MDEFPRENRSLPNFDFNKSTHKTSLAAWLRKWPNMTAEDQNALVIYKEGDDKTKYTIKISGEGQLVASDGKNSLVLENAKWHIPPSTQEILDKPIKPSTSGFGRK